MSYAYEYTKLLQQFGIIHLILKLTDSEGIKPESTIPVVLNESEYTDENLVLIANQIIDSYNTPLPIVEETPVVDPVVDPVVEETPVVDPVVNPVVVETLDNNSTNNIITE
jgi:hypothetical protein